MKYTKGPWRLDRDGWNGQYIYGNDERVKDKERFIAEVSLYYDGAEANARLISCAPEMLDALIYFIKRVKNGSIRSTKTYNMYVNIVEKATGLTIEEVLKCQSLSE